MTELNKFRNFAVLSVLIPAMFRRYSYSYADIALVSNDDLYTQ